MRFPETCVKKVDRVWSPLHNPWVMGVSTTLIALAGVVLYAGAARTATVYGELSDATVYIFTSSGDGGGTVGGVSDGDSNPFRVGGGGASPNFQKINAIFVFDLPALAPGEVFDSASFTLNLTAKEGTVTNFNVDLYALELRSSNTVLGDDVFVGAFNTDATNATGLTDNFLVSTTALGQVTTAGGVGSGATTLADFLNAQYALDSSAADKFLFIRASQDANSNNGNHRFRVNSADTTGTANDPRIDFTTVVPEPAGAWLVALGALSLGRRSRR